MVTPLLKRAVVQLGLQTKWPKTNVYRSASTATQRFDTLSVVTRLEARGVPSEVAETIATELHEYLKYVSLRCVSKSEMEEVSAFQEALLEARLSSFESQIRGSQERHFLMLQHRVDKLEANIKHQHNLLLDKQKLEMLELARERASDTREIISQFAEKEYNLMKYCMGTLFTISVVGLVLSVL